MFDPVSFGHGLTDLDERGRYRHRDKKPCAPFGVVLDRDVLPVGFRERLSDGKPRPARPPPLHAVEHPKDALLIAWIHTRPMVAAPPR